LAAPIAYIDASAFVKLVVKEPESRALRRSLEHWPVRASAVLLRTEVVRALRRSANDIYVAKARRLMRSVHLVQLDEVLLDRAADLGPPTLRSLDAVHLAAAMSLGPDLGILFAYDLRLQHAAESLGLAVASPA
jgi:predicted nucleic acid-binding protein